jgi:hypothetical protein
MERAIEWKRYGYFDGQGVYGVCIVILLSMSWLCGSHGGSQYLSAFAWLQGENAVKVRKP